MEAEWTTIMTATPIPYKHTDFGGLLSFVHSQYDNDEARNRINLAPGFDPLPNPYEVRVNGSLTHPELERFMYTAAAFERFCGPDEPFITVGPILARIWQRFMIRRDFMARCVINPQGYVHQIGSSMPKVHRYNLKLENDKPWQQLHDYLIKEHLTSQLTPDPNNPDSMVLNGRSTRILNLAAVSPLLLLARGIHKAKVEAERNSVTGGDMVDHDSEEESTDEDGPEDDIDEDGDEDVEVRSEKKEKRKKVESPELKEYRDLFMAQNWAGWMRKLMVDIYDNAKELGQHEQIFKLRGAVVHPETLSARNMAAILIRSSARLRAMFASIADQLDVRDEKSLIFANNPWESQLYAVILRIFAVNADAVLASQKGVEKEARVVGFQQPLRRWSHPGFKGVSHEDVEVLVLSYYMNSGLNLHHYCHILHAPSPPPSHSIWRQGCGRIVRFGQEFECIIISYYVARTYNAMQMAKMMKNALSSVAAVMCASDAKDDEDYVATRVSCKQLAKLHGFNGSLIHEDHADFKRLKASDRIENLTDSDKFLRILNATMGLTMKVGDTSNNAEGYAFEATADIFEHFEAVQKHGQTPKKDLRFGDPSQRRLSSGPASSPLAGRVDEDQPMDGFDPAAGPSLGLALSKQKREESKAAKLKKELAEKKRLEKEQENKDKKEAQKKTAAEKAVNKAVGKAVGKAVKTPVRKAAAKAAGKAAEKAAVEEVQRETDNSETEQSPAKPNPKAKAAKTAPKRKNTEVEEVQTETDPSATEQSPAKPKQKSKAAKPAPKRKNAEDDDYAAKRPRTTRARKPAK
jgi:hypothetical protein